MSEATLADAAEIVRRPYPLRRLARPNWVDRKLRRLSAEVATALRPRRLSGLRFIVAVDDATAALEPLDDAGIAARAERLSETLGRATLKGDRLVEAFALVRTATTRELGIRHRPCQVHGASLLIRGRMLEMATGEGKSATALLAAGAAALAGWRPHVVTVNDYLAERDRDAFAPVLARLGLEAGLVVSGTAPEDRALAYRRDLVFVNNKEVAFDFLKDRIALGRARTSPRARLRSAFGDPETHAAPRRLLHDGLRFAIVDEADSVLIDEAGTPLIISASDRITPDPEPYLVALTLSERLEEGRDWTVVAKERRVRLTRRGIDRAGRLAAPLGGLWAAPRAREERFRTAIAARVLFHRDREYVIAETEDGPAIQIVDEFTGRVMPDRSWESGLHQMIEAKEGVPLTAPRRSLARITYQRFFGSYLRLGGMTGTGMEIAAEMQAVFDLGTVPVPSHSPSQRRFRGLRLAVNQAAKHRRVARRARAMARKGRAVLIGTRSVSASEALSAVLAADGIAHVVLNARHDATEAGVIARAGEAGRVTVATNMAGRGTDIVLGPGVEAAGGLHVILTEHHESRRIDRQLHGRSGRQGDRGSAEEIVALDDDLYRRFVPMLTRTLLAMGPLGRLPPFPGLLRRAMQWRAERAAAAQRHLEARRDDMDARALAFAGSETD